MARLEIELAGVNDDLKRVLKESKVELSNFSKGLDFNTKGVTRVNDTLTATSKLLKGIIADAGKANTVLKTLNSSGIASSLATQRIATEQARTETEKYKSELARLNNELKAAQIAQQNANVATAQGKTAQQAARTEQAKANSELAKLRLANVQNKGAVTALSGSYREAQQRLTALGKSIREAKNGFDSTNPAVQKQIQEYRALNEQLKAFDRQLGNHQRNVGNYKSALEGLRGLAASYFGFTALLATGRAIINNNAKISDSLADVRRTAGLTEKEVNNLADTLKKVDTRTNLADLLGIATIGGQLGIAKDQLAGFTKAIDQLSVALGGELQGGAEGIAKSLGVLDNVFGITTQNAGDVNKAYNQIGSAILGLGQSGLATGDFLADFGERVGGVARQAGLSLPVILSYGAVLQENGVSAEVAGTSFKKLISALATNSSGFFAVAKFADANLTLKEFNTLVNTDTKRALDLFFTGLKAGGKSTIAFNTILKDLKLSQAGVSQSIAALATGQETLNGHIQDATKDFNDATLAGEQFRIKNDNLAGSVDKLVNTFVNATTSGAIGNFFKSIIDYIRISLSEFNNLVNSKSWNEFFTKLRDNSSKPFDLSKGFAKVSKVTKDNQQFLYPNGGNQESLEKKLRDRGINFNRQYLANLKKTMDEAERLANEYEQGVKEGKLKETNVTVKDYKENYQKAKAYYEDVAALQKKLGFTNKTAPLVRPDTLAPTGFGKGKKGSSGSSAMPKDYAEEIAEVAAKATDFESLLLSENLDATNEKTRQKYAKLTKDLDDIQKQYTFKYQKNGAKIKELDAQNAEARKQIQANLNNELAKNASDYAEKQADIIAGIEERAGIERETSQQRELDQSEAYYNELARKYKDNADILNAITRARVAADEQILEKWQAKRLDAEQKISDQIEGLVEKGFTDNVNGSARANAQLDRQLAERLAKVRDYFDKLRKMNANNPIANLALGAAEGATVGAITDQAAQAKNPVAERLKEELSNAVQGFGQDFVGVLRRINQQADKSFTGVLGSIGESLSSQLENVFDNQLRGILKNLVDGVKITTSQAITALGGLAGGLVSGITKKTSYLGQGLGGALTGAASGAGLGAAIGTAGGPIGIGAGAVIGGLIGAIGGIFGAGKARKQEALEKAQLEEQKKQTALLERQNALAYASQIIGRQTTQGVVTGVEVNEFGELVTKISGNDIDVVWRRSQKSKSRGV